jgi:XTP/dITP diphosphohydrolase
LTELGLTIATTNPGKEREIRRLLRGLPVRVRALPKALQDASCRERGRNFSENARAKAVYYSRKVPGLVLAEDSGLEVAFLGGAPGVRSARFSSPAPSDEKNIRKVLRLLRGVGRGDRSARFVSVMALAENGRVIKELRGQVRGRVAFEPRGYNGFGYDPVFYYHPLRRTFAELSPDEKNAVSHRGRALRKLRAFLEKHLAERA